MVQVSKLYDHPLLRKTTNLRHKTSLFFIVRGPNSVHSEVFRSWWSQWYKFQSCMMIHFWENTFWAKTSLFIVFRVPNFSYTLRFSGLMSTMAQVSKLYDDPFLKKRNKFWDKTSLFFVFRESNSVHSEVFRSDDHNGTNFKAVWWSISEKTHFGLKHSLSFVFRVPNSVYPEVFRSDEHNGTSFKAVWWSISEKKHILGQSITFLCI